eukprot:SAG31_NODE_849_length_11529_cov_3.342257_9_plen_171_part_00
MPVWSAHVSSASSCQSRAASNANPSSTSLHAQPAILSVFATDVSDASSGVYAPSFPRIVVCPGISGTRTPRCVRIIRFAWVRKRRRGRGSERYSSRPSTHGQIAEIRRKCPEFPQFARGMKYFKLLGGVVWANCGNCGNSPHAQTSLVIALAEAGWPRVWQAAHLSVCRA